MERKGCSGRNTIKGGLTVQPFPGRHDLPGWSTERAPGQRDGKTDASQGLCLQPEMPNRAKGCVCGDKTATEPPFRGGHFGVGVGGINAGDREESVMGRLQGGGERAEKRKWGAGVLAASPGEDHSNR